MPAGAAFSSLRCAVARRRGLQRTTVGYTGARSATLRAVHDRSTAMRRRRRAGGKIPARRCDAIQCPPTRQFRRRGVAWRVSRSNARARIIHPVAAPTASDDAYRQRRIPVTEYKREAVLTSAGLLIPLISHFASADALSFSVTFSTATSCDVRVNNPNSSTSRLELNSVKYERAAAALAAAATTATACTRSETANTCLHTTSVSAEMPERAASRGGGREQAIWGKSVACGGGEVEPVRSGVCADDCGANSAKRTTTRSRLASSTSNLALFKNEDGAALKSDKFLIGRSRRHPYFDAIVNESRFYSGVRCSATFRRDFTFNALKLAEDEGFESSWPERDVRFEATSLDSNKPWRCESFYVGFEGISRSREIDRHPIRTCERPRITAKRSSGKWTARSDPQLVANFTSIVAFLARRPQTRALIVIQLFRNSRRCLNDVPSS
ncbi:hypothetical protein ALC60_13430 [Trachymyrmex zeteki]|uniref:Uncharacterized protein n=1 Tax=Mycetomoellerius zeteki TaxID=64791 RepID=A0A151WIL8_9HYME|nr:hypothetical protein ALC60_13430 [Trachymyrmex zeteki]